jgi:RHS repeat-associated protein
LARQDSSGNTYWYQTDRLGSVIGVTNASGTVVDTITYDGFGNILSESAPNYGGNLLFQGMWLDRPLEMYVTPRRDYTPSTGDWSTPDPSGFTAGDDDLYRFVGNNPTDATDPSGLEPGGMDSSDDAWDEAFRRGNPSNFKGGQIFIPGSVVMRNLGFSQYSWFGLGGETFEYSTLAQGCMGLNKLRLNNNFGPFTLPNAQAFATLEAAVEAQKAMVRMNDKGTRIVISAYQDNYLDEQLTPFLLPMSKTEYDLGKIRAIRAGFPGIKPKGNLSTFDFVTLHQNADLSVLFYETMDFGISKNSNLDVIHKLKLYPPNRAGTIYIVAPITNHSRAPLSPIGEK